MTSLGITRIRIILITNFCTLRDIQSLIYLNIVLKMMVSTKLMKNQIRNIIQIEN